MPYNSKPGTRKMGENPLQKRSCYKMKGFSGFGNSPATKKSGKSCNCWKGHSRVPGTKPCTSGSCKKD